MEWCREGIDVGVLSRGLIDTEMVRGSAIGTARTPFPVTAPGVVTAALDGLGRRPVVVPGAVAQADLAPSRDAALGTPRAGGVAEAADRGVDLSVIMPSGQREC